ncbi:RsbT co-antagonist protein RsbRD N-terminal domain-containing protein [Candidatus Magnetomoraceae bacterium gMMP-15]
MELYKLLAEKKSSIIKKWFKCVIDTYPEDTSRFLKREKDPFANPVGQNALRGLEVMFEHLLQNKTSDELISFLDPIIRIRAIQDFSPSKAVGFIFAIKKVIREDFCKDFIKDGKFEEILDFESRVDSLVLLGFDIYMTCREKLYDIKANELKNLYFRKLEKGNILREIPNEEAGPPK